MDWFATNYCMDLILVLVNGVMVYSGTRPSIACLFIKIGEKYYIVSKHQATVTGDRARHPYTHSISLTLPPRPAKRHCLNSRLMRSQTTAGDEATLSKMISPFIFCAPAKSYAPWGWSVRLSFSSPFVEPPTTLMALWSPWAWSSASAISFYPTFFWWIWQRATSLAEISGRQRI